MSHIREEKRSVACIALAVAALLLVGCGNDTPPEVQKKRSVVSRKISVPGKNGNVADKGLKEDRSMSESRLPGIPAYDPSGRIDPFQPPRPSNPDPVSGKKVVRKRRKPQTPLERMELGQLRLVGIVGTPTGKTAMVEDPKGKGYVVDIGTFIGIHTGKVTAIERDRVIITEIVEDFTGELKEVQRQLQLQKPTGE